MLYKTLIIVREKDIVVTKYILILKIIKPSILNILLHVFPKKLLISFKNLIDFSKFVVDKSLSIKKKLEKN